MKCPFCSSENTRVIDSRPADDNNSIRRRRLCDDCGKRFTTYEKVETIPLIVIKKDNIREQYDRSKIEAGVLRACHKRPISADQISNSGHTLQYALYISFSHMYFSCSVSISSHVPPPPSQELHGGRNHVYLGHHYIPNTSHSAGQNGHSAQFN